MRDWVQQEADKFSKFESQYSDVDKSKLVILERVEPIPKMNIYSVQPMTCYVPSWEKYKFATDGVRYERKFVLEEETLIEEIAIKNMSSEEIIKALTDNGVIDAELLEDKNKDG